MIERAGESALLRALGLTRGQLRGMLLTEAVLMAALATVTGTALGTGFGFAIIHAFGEYAGFPAVLSVPVRRLALYALAAVAAAVLADVGPARRAARAPVTAVT